LLAVPTPAPQISMPFAANVVAARQAAGLTQEQLARAAGVTLRTVQGWENEGRRPTQLAHLLALAAALGKDDPAWFDQRHPDEPVAA
jgi:transcriptional regulator with XRE-family HTH domain